MRLFFFLSVFLIVSFTLITPSSLAENSQFKLSYHSYSLKKWERYFSHKSKDRFIRFLSNGHKYREVIESIFSNHGLPKELFYVGLIESGYYLKAKSRAKAVGPWQFMKPTAKHYGLRVDRAVDERINVIKATQAAASYFKDLYNIFGDWSLALAAYNAGEYRIIRAIRRGNTRSFKQLSRRKLIPRETANYVPKVAAAMKLDKRFKKYAAKNSAAKKLFKKTKKIVLKRNFSLKKMAARMGHSYWTLKKLNPDLKHRNIKVGKLGHTLIVPSKYNYSSRKVASSYSQSYRRNSSKGSIHRVKRGEYLLSIAKRYGLKLDQIKKLNGLKSTKIYPGQRLKIRANSVARRSRNYHKVRRGEHLSLIADKYKTSIRSLKKVNSLKRNTLYVGEVLRIPRG